MGFRLDKVRARVFFLIRVGIWIKSSEGHFRETSLFLRNSIHTPRSSLYTPLKITIDENTNLPLNLLNTPHLRLFVPHFFLSSAHPFLRPKCVRIVRIGENGVEK